MPFEVALRTLLNQVDATWAVDEGVFKVLSKNKCFGTVIWLDALGRSVEAFPEYTPGDFTFRYDIPNPALFLSGSKRVEDTYSLLTATARRAGYKETFAYSYGNGGIVLILPAEALDNRDGARKNPDRFDATGSIYQQQSAINWPSMGFTLNPGAIDLPHFRVIALVVSSDPIRRDGVSAFSVLERLVDKHGLPDLLRKMVWKSTPKLTALIYDLHAEEEQSYSILRPTDTRATAESQLLDSGLWTLDEIRGK